MGKTSEMLGQGEQRALRSEATGRGRVYQSKTLL